MTRSLLLIILVIVSTLILFETYAVDLWLQDLFFDFKQQVWLVDRQNAVLKFIFYDGIKIAYLIALLGLSIALIFFRSHKTIKHYKVGLSIVLASMICVPTTIASLKAFTNTPCPKHLQHYGGEYPYVTVLTAYPESFKREGSVRCFPAGHASAGFALMSLYFLFNQPAIRKTALTSAIGLGWITGGYKMLIGDHFLSHTLMSMEIAWLIIILIKWAIDMLFIHKKRGAV